MNITDSSRLSYRLMTENDAQLLYELDQDPAVMKFINGGKPSSMDTITNSFIPRLKAFSNPDKGWGLWQVNTLDENSFIGWILVRPMHFFSDERNDEDLELGWRFKQMSWGKGYATEAAKHIALKLQQQNTYKAFSAIALENNHSSIGIMHKLGMKYLKHYVHKDPLGDLDVVLYSVTIKEQ